MLVVGDGCAEALRRVLGRLRVVVALAIVRLSHLGRPRQRHVARVAEVVPSGEKGRGLRFRLMNVRRQWLML